MPKRLMIKSIRDPKTKELRFKIGGRVPKPAKIRPTVNSRVLEILYKQHSEKLIESMIDKELILRRAKTRGEAIGNVAKRLRQPSVL